MGPGSALPIDNQLGAIAAACGPGSTLLLQAPPGAGKTTFVRHLLKSLGVQGRVKSPTYAVMEGYDVGWPVAHFDFYRFTDPQEWEDAGFRDIFAAPGLKICEWPHKAQGLLPRPDLAIALQTTADGQRRVEIRASTPTGLRLLNALVDRHG